jgi:hypothetical protein
MGLENSCLDFQMVMKNMSWNNNFTFTESKYRKFLYHGCILISALSMPSSRQHTTWPRGQNMPVKYLEASSFLTDDAWETRRGFQTQGNYSERMDSLTALHSSNGKYDSNAFRGKM